MFKIPKQSYTTEFKQEAVRLVENEGKSPAQVARDLGITATEWFIVLVVLTTWLRLSRIISLGYDDCLGAC